MSASRSLSHAVSTQIEAHTALAASHRIRLALLVTGIIAARTTVLAQIARHLCALRLTRARIWEHVARGLRRTLNDPLLTAAASLPAVRAALPRPGGARAWRVAVDESSQTDRVHLLRICASRCRFGATPPPLHGQYGNSTPPWHRARMRSIRTWPLPRPPRPSRLRHPSVCSRIAPTPLPPFLTVAPRAGGEGELRTVRARPVGQPGPRGKGRGWLFKGAGGRAVAVVATWEPGADEPVVVVTNVGARGRVREWYARRPWIEAGFRSDKSQGWQWEARGVRGGRHAVRLVAMAWASLFARCLGGAEARRALRRMAARHPSRHPPPARESVFTQGLQVLRAGSMGSHHAPAPCGSHISRRTVGTTSGLPLNLSAPEPSEGGDAVTELYSH